MANNKRIQQWLMVIAAFIFGINNAHQATAQDQEGSKGIRAAEVIGRRANPPRKAGLKKRKPTSKKPQVGMTYSSPQKHTRTRPTRGTEYVKVGVTIWVLQDGSKSVDQVGEESQTLEQVEARTRLAIGSNVRLGVEPLTRAGYLYVINREQFDDGTYGTPRLIFPTTRTRKGNNYVRRNERVLIPRKPSYFRINQSSTGKTQVAEVLTFIISSTPLQLPKALGETAMILSDDKFKEWEGKWSAPVNEFEMEQGAGRTIGEKDLGQVGEESQQLTEDDPFPQTVYRATIKKGNPLLVTIPLHFNLAAATVQQPN
jgi:hypothetical protein